MRTNEDFIESHNTSKIDDNIEKITDKLKSKTRTGYQTIYRKCKFTRKKISKRFYINYNGKHELTKQFTTHIQLAVNFLCAPRLVHLLNHLTENLLKKTNFTTPLPKWYFYQMEFLV